ncbi:PHP domain-containing protein, partial [uncultured Slackia sp.]|uniref:PHP domain-containing protein n=1 Tax=uncultured Slackia sp. TaxID=665903 RepID=UPI0025D42080
MPQLVDCHTHTLFSDGKATFRQNMRAAASAGLATIACTDHLAHPAFMDCAIDESRLDEYAAEIRHMREEFPQLKIVHGFEADWYPGCEADIAATRGSATFLLGSIHYLNEFAIDWDEDMRAGVECGADGVWHRYVDSWCEACFCPARFDSMAHPDLPRLMGPAGYAPTIALEPL